MRLSIKLIFVIVASLGISFLLAGTINEMLFTGVVEGSIASIGGGSLNKLGGLLVVYMLCSSLLAYLITKKIKYGLLVSIPVLIPFVGSPKDLFMQYSIISLIFGLIIAWVILYLKKLFTKP